jgi:hypothetical protein
LLPPLHPPSPSPRCAPTASPPEPAAVSAGTSRSFTVTALRAHGIPARRCFGRYFTLGWHGDHCVVEYWSAASSRWVLADAQLNPELCQALVIAFDPAEGPREEFVVAGAAWIRCREGNLDPFRCGLEGEGQSGAWVDGNLASDVAALSKVELLPWGVWGEMPGPDDPITNVLAEELDQVAAITADPDTAAESRRPIRVRPVPGPDARLQLPAANE